MHTHLEQHYFPVQHPHQMSLLHLSLGTLSCPPKERIHLSLSSISELRNKAAHIGTGDQLVPPPFAKQAHLSETPITLRQVDSTLTSSASIDTYAMAVKGKVTVLMMPPRLQGGTAGHEARDEFDRSKGCFDESGKTDSMYGTLCSTLHSSCIHG